MTNRYLLLIATGAVSLSMSDAALACRCAGRATLQQSYGRADAVVIADVTAVSGDIDAEGGAIATLNTGKAWKSKVPPTLKVESRSTCAFDFKAGERYLVYLSRSGVRAAYSTTICAGNLHYAQSGAAVKWLQAHGTPTSN